MIRADDGLPRPSGRGWSPETELHESGSYYSNNYETGFVSYIGFIISYYCKIMHANMHHQYLKLLL